MESQPSTSAAGRRTVGFFLSFIAPGAGHILLGRWRRGLTLTAALIALWLLIPVTRLAGMGAVLLMHLAIPFDQLFIRARARPPLGRLALAWAALFIGLVTARATFRSRYLTAFKLPGSAVAMQPTLLPGDNLFAAAYLRRPARGDVIAYHPASDDDGVWIHRVIGVAGDRLEIDQAGVVLNGIRLATTPLPRCEYSAGTCSEESVDGRRHLIERDPGEAAVVPTYRGVVPPGAVFVMGDHRDDSVDSRTEGVVPLDRVVGTALFVWWSATPSLEYRYERFGLRLR